MKKSLCFAALSAGTVLAGAGAASAQEASPPSDQPASRPHTVAAGETLSKISQAELGTSHRWVELFAFNRDIVANPDLIEVGQVLDIPSAPVPLPHDVLARLAPAPARVAAPAASAAASPAPVTRRSARNVAPATRSNAVRAKGGGGNLAAIRACESGGNYAAVSSSGRYRGAYQFDRQTWQSVGGSGDPAAASPAEQDARARQLLGQRGSNPWPNCG